MKPKTKQNNTDFLCD